MSVSVKTLTIQNALDVKKKGLAAIDAGDFEVDLRNTSEVDSSAVSVLFAWERYARRQGGSLRIVGMPQPLEALLRLYGVHPLFDSILAKRN